MFSLYILIIVELSCPAPSSSLGTPRCTYRDLHKFTLQVRIPFTLWWISAWKRKKKLHWLWAGNASKRSWNPATDQVNEWEWTGFITSPLSVRLRCHQLRLPRLATVTSGPFNNSISESTLCAKCGIGFHWVISHVTNTDGTINATMRPRKWSPQTICHCKCCAHPIELYKPVTVVISW